MPRTAKPAVKRLRLTEDQLLSLQIFPVWMLTRSMRATWEFWGAYQSEAAADEDYNLNIRGHGVTAMVWIGPMGEGVKMLADPRYEAVMPGTVERLREENAELKEACKSALSWIGLLKSSPRIASVRLRLQEQLRTALGRTVESERMP